MLQLKDTEWLNGYRNKTCIYATKSRLTSYLKTLKRLKMRGWKNIPCKWKGKVDLHQSTDVRRRYNNYKYIYIDR